MESKDIQNELTALTNGMTLHNTLSQFAYWISETCLEQVSVDGSSAYLHFLGLLSDSHFGLMLSKGYEMNLSENGFHEPLIKSEMYQ